MEMLSIFFSIISLNSTWALQRTLYQMFNGVVKIRRIFLITYINFKLNY
jgi:hypothetical protein